MWNVIVCFTCLIRALYVVSESGVHVGSETTQLDNVLCTANCFLGSRQSRYAVTTPLGLGFFLGGDSSLCVYLFFFCSVAVAIHVTFIANVLVSTRCSLGVGQWAIFRH